MHANFVASLLLLIVFKSVISVVEHSSDQLLALSVHNVADKCQNATCSYITGTTSSSVFKSAVFRFIASLHQGSR